MSARRTVRPRSRRSAALVTALLLLPLAPGVAAAATTGGADLAFAPAPDPSSAPGVPTDVQAVGGDGAVAVSWSAPTDEADAITDYGVLVRPEGFVSWDPVVEVPGTTTQTTVTGLVNGTTYEVAVAARNALGWGTSSTPVSATPKAASSVAVHTVPAEPVLGESFRVYFTVTSGGLPVPDTTVDVTFSNGTTLPVPLVDGVSSVGSIVTAPSTYTTTLAYPGTAAIGPSSATYTQVFPRAPQVITFDPPPPATATYGDAPVTIGATADSGLLVTLGAAGPCAVDGTTLSFTGAGTCTVTASQAGDETREPTTATATVTIAKAPTVTMILLHDVGPTLSSFTFVVIAGDVALTSGTVAVELDGWPTGSWSVNTTIHYSYGSPRLFTVEASFAGTDDHLPSSTSVVVDGRLPQTLDLDAALPDSAPALTALDLPVTTAVGLPVSYRTTTPDVCTADGTTLHLLGVGTCSVEGSSPGDTRHAALVVGASLTVGVGAQAVTITGVPETHTGAGTLPVTAVSSAGRPVTITTTGSCTWAAGTLSVVGTGECVVTATAPGDAAAPAADAVARMTVTAPAAVLDVRLDGAVGAPARGMALEGTATGLRPAAAVSLVVESTPVVVGSSIGDALGAASVFGSLPALDAGTHHAVLRGTALDGTAVAVRLAFGVGADGTITWIGHAVPGGLPATGAGAGSTGALAALGVLTGFALVLLRRRLSLVPGRSGRRA